MKMPVALSIFIAALFASASAAMAAAPAGAAPPPAASSTAAASDAGAARPGPHERYGSGPSGWRHSGLHHLGDLGLTPGQRADIQRLIEASYAQSAPEWRALRQKRSAFQQATPGTPGYVAARNDLAHAEANAALATVLRRSDLRTKIYAVLTPEQRTKLAAHEAQWRARRDAWRASGAKASS